jgi:hypothetical protein
MLLKDQ